MSLTIHPLLLECVEGPLDGDLVEAWPELGVVPAWAQRLERWPVHELEAYTAALGAPDWSNPQHYLPDWRGAQRLSAQLELTPPFVPVVQAAQPARAVGRYEPVFVPARSTLFLRFQALTEPAPDPAAG